MTPHDIADRLGRMTTLHRGWDGYDAPPPSASSIAAADRYLSDVSAGIRPNRVAPSAIGGVGITFRDGPRRVYVEFRERRGEVTGDAIFSDLDVPEPRYTPDAPDADAIRDFLTGNPA